MMIVMEKFVNSKSSTKSLSKLLNLSIFVRSFAQIPFKSFYLKESCIQSFFIPCCDTTENREHLWPLIYTHFKFAWNIFVPVSFCKYWDLERRTYTIFVCLMGIVSFYCTFLYWTTLRSSMIWCVEICLFLTICF